MQTVPKAALSTKHVCFRAWLGSIFVLKKEAIIPNFHFKETKVKSKKCEKDFRQYINIDSKCLNIDT